MSGTEFPTTPPDGVLETKGFRVDLTGADWKRSTQGQSGSENAVEVAFVDGVIALRDGKNPTGPVLIFTPDEWDAFVEGAKDGEFDL